MYTSVLFKEFLYLEYTLLCVLVYVYVFRIYTTTLDDIVHLAWVYTAITWLKECIPFDCTLLVLQKVGLLQSVHWMFYSAVYVRRVYPPAGLLLSFSVHSLRYKPEAVNYTECSIALYAFLHLSFGHFCFSIGRMTVCLFPFLYNSSFSRKIMTEFCCVFLSLMKYFSIL